MTRPLDELAALLEDPRIPPDVREEAGALLAGLRAPRYAHVGPDVIGGMGVVSVARDLALGREVAMKTLVPKLADHALVREMFEQEAHITAELEHPAIVSVHEVGALPDGRPYFTMRLVRSQRTDGRADTLEDIIERVHELERSGVEREGAGRWSLHRLVGLFSRVCDAVAYAHSRGVIHLDLKPRNILVGAFGEVVVVDWGIARRLERAPLSADRKVLGTPAYMSPEQAREEALGPASDVFSLGCILFHILTGRPPHEGRAADILSRIRSGDIPKLPGHASTADLPGTTIGLRFDEEEEPATLIPAELRRICERAREPELEKRLPDARSLAAEVDAWLDGSRRREEALRRVAQAREARPRIVKLREQAERLRMRAAGILGKLAASAPVDLKLPGWDLERAAGEAETAAEREELGFVQLLHAAIVEAPDLIEAHDLLAEHYQQEHARAETARDARRAATAAALLAAHDTGRYAGWLRGTARVSLATNPPGALVEVWSVVEARDRRLVRERVVARWTTPVCEAPLPRGSYIAELEAAGRPPLQWPFMLERDGHWANIPPGASDPRVVSIPEVGVGPGERWIGAGWTWIGGPPTVPGAGRWQQVWVDDFVIRATPVTNTEYIAFLDDLVRRGREAEALRHAPAALGAATQILYGRNEDGTFCLQPDLEGDTWDPEWPVVHVSWEGARAFAAWEAERTGLPWRLPLELEWEKAARGVDGRRFPWGEHFDATWCQCRDSSAKPLPVRVGDVGADVGPYGVTGMAGNVRTWCLDAWRADGPLVVGDRPAPADLASDGMERRAIRGGAWNASPNYSQCAARDGDAAVSRRGHLGLRLVRSA